MKKLFTITLIIFVYSAKADYWTQKADFGGSKRVGGFSFAIGNKGYIGCGYDTIHPLDDFWEYDPATNVWTQKANFPMITIGVSGFSILNKGYAGIGQSSSGNCLQNFWEYDTTSNSWNSKANFPGSVRYGTACFTIADKGFICCGDEWCITGLSLTELWQYDPLQDQWMQKSSFPGVARRGSSVFVINNKAYFGLGGLVSNPFVDFWEYDYSTNNWSQKSNFAGNPRSLAISFVLSGIGYMGLGGYGYPDLWQYNVASDTWSIKNNFPGTPRTGMSFFSIGNKGYAGLGISSFPVQYTYFNDFWEYTPDSTTNIQETNKNYLSVNIFPNPFVDKLNVLLKINTQSEIILYDIASRKILQQKFTNSVLLNTEQLAKGLYLYEVRNKNGLCKKGKVVKDCEYGCAGW